MSRDPWRAEIKRAVRELRKSAALIESTKRGTPSGKPKTWKRGKTAPSSRGH